MEGGAGACKPSQRKSPLPSWSMAIHLFPPDSTPLWGWVGCPRRQRQADLDPRAKSDSLPHADFTSFPLRIQRCGNFSARARGKERQGGPREERVPVFLHPTHPLPILEGCRRGASPMPGGDHPGERHPVGGSSPGDAVIPRGGMRAHRARDIRVPPGGIRAHRGYPGDEGAGRRARSEAGSGSIPAPRGSRRPDRLPGRVPGPSGLDRRRHGKPRRAWRGRAGASGWARARAEPTWRRRRRHGTARHGGGGGPGPNMEAAP